MRNLKQNFIVVEGADGAGKTALLNNLELQLKEDGFDVIRVREPGGTPWSEGVRSLVLHADADDKPNNKAVLTAMFLSRFHLYDTRIAPALAAGKVVLCDRFVASTFAYQVYGKDYIYGEMFDSLNRFGEFVRYQSVVLDVTYEESIKRRSIGRDSTFEDDMEALNSSKEAFSRLRRGVKNFYESTQYGTYTLIDTTDKTETEVATLALESLTK